jgi:hypothetical protein
MEDVYLCASVISHPNSLYIDLTSETVLSGVFKGLLDCGSTHCFADHSFVKKNNLHVYDIPPVRLRLFDGSVKAILRKAVDIPIRFPSGEITLFTFYVTQLDTSSSVVIGYNWLTRYNPLVDWVLGQITFRTPVRDIPPTSLLSDSSAESSPKSDPLLASESNDSPPPNISLVNASAFIRACNLEGSQCFRLDLSPSEPKVYDPDPTLDLNKIPKEYHDYADVFSRVNANKLAEHRPYDLKINLEEGKSPPLGTMYSLSQVEIEALKKFVDENLSMGFIVPSESSHGAPVLFVKKKDGHLRLCVDYRGLNAITKKDRYPLPLISDLLDVPRKARVYTKIDLAHAYHLVRIAEGDEWKTAFRTRYGSFEWRVIPEGLSNAPAAFQRFMNDVFADLLDVYVIIYLDDILVYSNDPSEHAAHVREVLRRLRKHGMYARVEKCYFSVDTVEYLGYILSPEGLSMDESKVEVIKNWPIPRKVKDIQSFLGFANFYRRFIHQYSDIVIPLTRLTRKGIPWNFNEECHTAFENLKKAFITAPVLTHWYPDAEMILETDASDYAIAAILNIITEEKEIHPVAFHSRTLNSSELNYDTHDKELLAIFEAFRTWRRYLEGSAKPISVITDHKNLEYFSTTKLLSRRQARWSEKLAPFNFVIRFRPGKLGTKPDALTRRWDVYPKGGDSDYASVNPQNFRPVFTQEHLVASYRATYMALPILRSAIIMDVDKLHLDIKNAIPKDNTSLSRFEYLSSGNTDPRWSIDEHGLLRLDDRIWVPDADDLRLRILQYKHDHILSGHFGQSKTIDLIRREYVWPKLRTFVKEFCKTCVTCLRSKSPRHRPYGLLKQLPIPERPWNSISMDFIEKLPLSSGCDAILVIVDRLSKQGIFISTTDTVTSAELAMLFVIHVFSKHGVPSHITSDRGSEFVSHFFRSLGKALDMNLHFTSGYHPEADGQTERTNQTLEQYIRVYCNYQQDNWKQLLPLAEFAYNNAPNATTGISPFFANKGYNPSITVYPERDLTSNRAREFTIDLDELHQELRRRIAEAQKRYQKSADARRIPAPDFKVGQNVMVKAEFIHTTRPSKKLAEKNFGPYPIIGEAGSRSFIIKLPDSMRAVHPVFHVSMLEPAPPNTIPNRIQSPPPPVEIDGEPEFEISEILDSKLDNRRRCKLLYLVKWAGYEGTDEETSWILATELGHASEIVADFHLAYPDKPGPLENL